MRARLWAILASSALAAVLNAAPPALAAQCGDSPEGFGPWLEDFKQVAINDGVSPDVVDQALATAKYDPSVLAHDHGQGSLQGDFATFAARHITASRIKKGKNMLIAYAEPLDRIEQRLRRAGPGAGGDLGPGDGFRGRSRALSDLHRARDARLRLPARLALSGRTDRRLDDRPARPSDARSDARRLGGRTRADPVHAVRLSQIRRFSRTAGAAAT